MSIELPPDRAGAVRPNAGAGLHAQPGDGREQGYLHKTGIGTDYHPTIHNS